MKDIILLLPYFGNLPNYFQLWLDSAGKNPNINFLLLTDNTVEEFKIPENVNVVKMDLQIVRERVKKVLPYKFELSKPYKICDYKPIYGLIFSDLITGYKFWGHCDSDIIFGKLDDFITDKILKNYDKIYLSGHLSLIRNNEQMNNIPLQDSQDSLITAKNIYKIRYIAHYDESPLLINKYQDSKARIYKQIDCADVLYMQKQFRLTTDYGTNSTCYFHYDKHGRIYGYDENQQFIKEYVYVHLQKRKMNISLEEDHEEYYSS